MEIQNRQPFIELRRVNLGSRHLGERFPRIKKSLLGPQVVLIMPQQGQQEAVSAESEFERGIVVSWSDCLQSLLQSLGGGGLVACRDGNFRKLQFDPRPLVLQLGDPSRPFEELREVSFKPGETRDIPAKPASVKIRMVALKSLKESAQPPASGGSA